MIALNRRGDTILPRAFASWTQENPGELTGDENELNNNSDYFQQMQCPGVGGGGVAGKKPEVTVSPRREQSRAAKQPRWRAQVRGINHTLRL